MNREDQVFISLQQSEAAVAGMAATIFAGMLQKCNLGADNEDELIERSLAIAIKMARRADQLIFSGEELDSKPRKD